MELNPNQKYRWPVKEKIRHLNRCLYPELHEVDLIMERMNANGPWTQLALNCVREKLCKERNIPIEIL